MGLATRAHYDLVSPPTCRSWPMIEEPHHVLGVDVVQRRRSTLILARGGGALLIASPILLAAAQHWLSNRTLATP